MLNDMKIVLCKVCHRVLYAKDGPICADCVAAAKKEEREKPRDKADPK